MEHKRSLTMKRVPFGLLPGIAIRAAIRFGPPFIANAYSRADVSLRTDRPTFVFRVDDYPRWDIDSSEFPAFDDVFRALDVPYLLGITPWCEFPEGVRHWIGDSEADYLRELRSQGRVELALHGFTHTPRSVRGYTTEIAVYGSKELKARIAAAESWFDSRMLSAPRAFIPPFNTFTIENFLVLREVFEAILAGPPALSSFGTYSPQVWEGTIYVPSSRLLSGLSTDIMKGLGLVSNIAQLHVVTIHWAWERRSEYGPLKNLVKRVKAIADVWTLEEAINCLTARKS